MRVPGVNVYSGAVDWPRALGWLAMLAGCAIAWALCGVLAWRAVSR